MQQPPNHDGGTGSELRADAQQLGSTAANRLHSEVDSRKSNAVSQAQSLSSAISQAADGLDENSPDWLKSAFRQGAQQIQRLADTVEQKDSRQLMGEAQDFARNNPGTFLAACAAVGFAAARVLKAGSEQQRRQQFTGDQQFGGNQPGGQSQSFHGQSDAPARATQPAFGTSVPSTGAAADTPGEFA